MSRRSTVNHNIRHKSDGNRLLEHFLQNNGQNQKVLRRVVSANTSPSIIMANQQKSQPLPQAFPAGTGILSQISHENMRDIAFPKVFKPPTIPTPRSPAFKRSNSNGVHSILPFKKKKYLRCFLLGMITSSYLILKGLPIQKKICNTVLNMEIQNQL